MFVIFPVLVLYLNHYSIRVLREQTQYPSLTMPELCLQEYGFVTVLFFNIYRLFVNPVTARGVLVSLQYQSFAKAITVSDF